MDGSCAEEKGSSMVRQLHFQFSQRLEGYTFNPHRPEGISFSEKTDGLEIEIRSDVAENDPGYGHRNLVLKARLSVDIDERQYDVVTALIEERRVIIKECPITLPYKIREREVVDANGVIAKGYSITADFLPPELQQISKATGDRLQEAATRFVQILRWSQGCSGPYRISSDSDSRVGLYWKTVQERYHSVPWPKQGPLEIGMEEGIQWSTEHQEEVTNLWQSTGLQEPLGHQILREAKGVRDENYRSALLICYSALEVGLKQHISKCAPDAGWFAMYAPSPPIFKVLRDFLPVLHKGKNDFSKWGNFNPELKKAIEFTEDRNKLAHRGEAVNGSVDAYLRFTEDILYILDVLEGHSWAKARVSSNSSSLLGWGPGKEESVLELFVEQ